MDPGEALDVARDGPRFVSRGGFKLEAALERFRVDVAGVRVIDAGSSTGGFTDCLLRRGAREVVAIDVGRHQLHERLRTDARVVLHEQTDVRAVVIDSIGGPAPVVVADLSFISVRAVAPDLVGLVDRPGDLIVLVKPQFEAGKREADRGRGVIRDPEVWRRTITGAAGALDAAGAAIMEAMVSPIRGAEGNVEFFLCCRVAEPRPEPELGFRELAALVVDEVEAG